MAPFPSAWSTSRLAPQAPSRNSRQPADSERNREEEESQQPLRKKLKSQPIDQEYNFTTPNAAANQSTLGDLALLDEQAMKWLRQEHQLEVEGLDIPRVMCSFDELPLPRECFDVLRRRSITTPTAIQMQMIPSVLAGRDVVALSKTGSGKTLSYLLPLLLILQQRKCQQSQHVVPLPLALILVPTRELMEQIFSEMCAFGLLNHHKQQLPQARYTFFRCFDNFQIVGICGGVSFQQESAVLQSVGADVVVATPGRLLHHLTTDPSCSGPTTRSPSTLLGEIKYLVLDEVDRMLDAEMEPQIREILGYCNDLGRQTLILSATMPHFLDRLARSAVLNPVIIRVGIDSDATCRNQMPEQVEQRVVFLKHFEKKTKLLAVLRSIESPPVVIFCNSHDCVDFVSHVLQREQFHVAPLHGAKSQKYRFQVMRAFRDGFVDVLVTTDLASRGIDVSNVKCIINYDMPVTIEDYVHRCGRTGRRKHERGLAVSLLTCDCTIPVELKQLLQENQQTIPPELINLRHFFPQVSLSKP